MIVNRVLSFFLLTLSTANAWGQDTAVIDSLLTRLNYDITASQRIEVYLDLAYQYRRSDSANTARYAQLAIQLADEVGDRAAKADAYYEIGWAAMSKGHYETAKNLYSNVVTLSDDANFLEGKAKGYNGLGIISFYRGHYATALDNYLKSLAVREMLGDSVAIARSYNNIGGVYFNQENYPQALKYYFSSLKIKEALDDLPGLTRSCTNVGLVYKLLNKYDSAVHYYGRSLELKKAMGNWEGVADSHSNIGLINQMQGNLKEARIEYDQALAINKQFGNENATARTYQYLGNLSKAEGNLDTALKHYLTALDVFEALGSKIQLSSLLLEIGDAYWRKQDFLAARSSLQQSLSFANEIGLLENKKTALELLAKVYEGLRDFEQAYTIQVQFKMIADSLRSDEQSRRLARLEATYEFQKIRDSLEYANRSERLLMDQRISREQNRSSVFLAGSIVLLIGLFVTYRFFDLKRRANRELMQRHEEIRKSREEIQQQRDNLEEALAELQRTQSMLIQSEKMASIGMLTAGLNHEINNPLNFITGGLFGIHDTLDEETNRQIKSYTDVINEGVKRISSIVQSLKRFSQQDPDAKADCRLDEILDNCLAVTETKRNGHVAVNRQFLAKSPNLFGSEVSLFQAFFNILNNAEQAIQEEGSITVSLEEDSEQLQVSITDTGKGIPREDLLKVADPFFTTKTDDLSRKGLGLTIAYTIIKDHSGELSIESEEGKGTKVVVSLPRSGKA